MGLMGLMGLVGPCSFGASNLIPSLRRFGWTPFSGKVRRRCLDRAARECLRAALAAFDSRTFGFFSALSGASQPLAQQRSNEQVAMGQNPVQSPTKIGSMEVLPQNGIPKRF